MDLFCSSFPSGLEEIFPWLIYLTNGLSAFGSIMVLMTYVLLPKLRSNWLMRYLAYLNISNLFYGIMTIIVYHDIFNDHYQSFTASFFILFCFKYSSLIWPLILVINLYQMVAKRKNNLSYYEFLWLFIGFALPTITVYIMNHFGLIQFHQSLDINIIQYIIPVILMVSASLLTYVKLIKAAKVNLQMEEAKNFIKMILPYPVIAITISVPAIAFNILYSSEGCFTLLSSVFLLIRFLQGAFDSIAFSFNIVLKEERKKYFKRNELIVKMEIPMY